MSCTDERIEALLMIMTLSLLVYASLEHKIREQLAQTEAFFPSMVKNKTTAKPTARWVFLQFEGIDTFRISLPTLATGNGATHSSLPTALGSSRLFLVSLIKPI